MTSAERHIDLLSERYPLLVPCVDSIRESIVAITDCHRSGGKVLLCGNGGSAADAEHMVGELVKSFVLPRPIPGRHKAALESLSSEFGSQLSSRLQRGVRAFALSGSSPLSTAIVNDGDPDLLFAQMAYVYGHAGDVVVGISTSGNSKNVLYAFTVARALGMVTIGLTGERSAKIDGLSDIVIKVPASETFKIQEYHLPVYHTICLAVESELFEELDEE